MSSRLHTHFIPIWKEAPFLRLVIPLMLGIVLEWYLGFAITTVMVATLIGGLIITVLLFTRHRAGYRFGIAASCLTILAGCWLVVVNHPDTVRNNIRQHAKPGATIVATIDEPLVIKEKTFKANATIKVLDSNNNLIRLPGSIIVYFLKDTGNTGLNLKYGDQVAFTKELADIKGSGNPGAFDFSRYAAFQGIHFQVFLKPTDYVVLSTKSINPFNAQLYNTRDFVLSRFKKYIPGKAEAGLAEALLVGYKDDLDKSIVEDYAKTGVVHIIAISGMHLGLIYFLLLAIFKPLKRLKYGTMLSGILIIMALWFFSFLTGAAPSITRSALMFSAIILGNSFDRKMSIYNSLAVSAFVLLVVNPFNLWNVGFQLSYAAIISIAILGKPITNLFASRFKLVQKTWELVAVTMAAQVFTLPLVLYHFHQFPLLFILSNLIAVPLSSLVLFGLIALLALSIIPVLAQLTGWLCFWMIKFMNAYIAFIASLSFSRIDNLYLSIPQAVFLALFLAAVCWCIFRYTINALTLALTALLGLLVFYNIQLYQTSKQQKLIVYNLPKKLAVDIIQGNKYTFIGDTSLTENNPLINFHLLPSRIQYRVSKRQDLMALAVGLQTVHIQNKTILLLGKTLGSNAAGKQHFDIVIAGGGCRTKPYKVLQMIGCNTVVLDPTVPLKRINEWKIAADSLHLRLHSIQQQGAFEIDL